MRGLDTLHTTEYRYDRRERRALSRVTGPALSHHIDKLWVMCFHLRGKSWSPICLEGGFQPPHRRHVVIIIDLTDPRQPSCCNLVENDPITVDVHRVCVSVAVSVHPLSSSMRPGTIETRRVTPVNAEVRRTGSLGRNFLDVPKSVTCTISWRDTAQAINNESLLNCIK
jgi:hypothetical protein